MVLTESVEHLLTPDGFLEEHDLLSEIPYELPKGRIIACKGESFPAGSVEDTCSASRAHVQRRAQIPILVFQWYAERTGDCGVAAARAAFGVQSSGKRRCGM